jgi:hypothetical protein
MEDGKIEIEGLYESRDFWRSSLNHYFSLSAVYYSFWWFVFYGVFITFLFLRGDAGIGHFVDIILTSFVFVFLVGLAMAYFSFTHAMRLKWGKHKFTFSNERIEIICDSYTSFIKWDYFTQIRELKSYFVLYSQISQKTLVPKRFFRDSEQLAGFKNLVRDKLGEKALLKKSKERLGLK